jgi:glycosyltransferase involved in cell wall biosynthesis
MRVTIITEGTYPYVVGGVSSWCHDLITGLPDIEWNLVPITAGGLRRESLFDLPDNVTLEAGIELWSRPIGRRGSRKRRPPTVEQELLPADLCRLLLGDGDDHEALQTLFGKCRLNPEWARAAFRSDRAWKYFIEELRRVSAVDTTDLFVSVEFTALEATELWQALYWVAMTATTQLPEADVVLVTAAGWGATMAAAELTQHNVPVVLAEHGIYVREAYLEAARTAPPAGRQFTATRLARGLTRLTYAITDRIAPVCDSHHPWEQALGARPEQLTTIVNGVTSPAQPAPPNKGQVITSVGRIDPLKDIVTMLRAAAFVCEKHPDARFVHYGPVSDANRDYNRMCLRVHEEMKLGDRFVFMGSTDLPRQAMRDADIYLSTSISEGLPLSLLEAMSEGRPVVSTNVGGCADAINGCGVLVNAGDAFGIAHGISFLLEKPGLAEMLGRRGHRRVGRRFSSVDQLASYNDMFEAVAG